MAFSADRALASAGKTFTENDGSARRDTAVISTPVPRGVERSSRALLEVRLPTPPYPSLRHAGVYFHRRLRKAAPASRPARDERFTVALNPYGNYVATRLRRMEILLLLAEDEASATASMGQQPDARPTRSGAARPLANASK